MNSCNFVGKLIKDPETRFTPSGIQTTSFTISVYNPFAQGEYKSDLINIVTWRKTAELCAERLTKGSLVGVETRYSPRSYDNNEGRKVYVHEFTANNVTFLDRSESPNSSREQRDPFIDDSKPIDISDDDLPWT